MKKKILIGVGVVLLAIVGFFTYSILTTRSHSPAKTTEYSSNGLDIKVVYCQPSKKGRVIFGEEGALQPNGKYWRLGANEATEITFSKNVSFGGKPVNAGTYVMYAVPGATTFNVSLNSELGRWGAMEPNYDLDVVKIDAPVTTTPAVTEQFVINFSNDSTTINMDFVWDQTSVTVPITVQ